MTKKIISVLLIISTLTACLMTNAFAIATTTDDIVNTASALICSKEGTYSSVVADDNGALSIGCLQWHATRALNLLKDIVKANPENAKKILGDALYNEITTATAWNTRILTTEEKTILTTFLSTDESKEMQDALLYSDVLSYVNHGKELGITSPAALVYFADVENQCGGGGSARVANAANELAGGAITLDILHQAALQDKAAGRSPARRNSVYNYCSLLGWEDSTTAEAYEVWNVTAEPTLNVRSGPGTTYDRVSSYTTGTEIIIYEQVTTDGTPWGRTSVGWVCLDYCEFVSRHEPDNNTFAVKFDANGGELSSKAKFSADITGINTSRATDALIIYTRAYGATTSTNQYGSEFTVSASGYAQNIPAYGICNSEIPAGGFVVSAHGKSHELIMGKISRGDYVVYSESEKTLDVYTNYQSFIAANKKATTGSAIGTLPTPTRVGYTFDGWVDKDGNKVEITTVVTATEEFTLTARWKPVSVKVSFDSDGDAVAIPSATITASGINSYRFTDMLIVYDNNRGSSTLTNMYGSEAAVNAEGVVTEIWAESPTGKGDHPIPKGGFVLSGHGTSSKWITKNISVGDRIVFNYETLEIKVYDESSAYYTPITAIYGQALGTLPSPTKDGFTFDGWVTESGIKYTAESLSDFTADTVLYTSWKKIGEETTPDTTPDTEPIPAKKKGDVDENGSVNASDILHLLKEIKAPGSTGYTNTDVDGDGKATAVDILELAKIIKEG